MQVSTKQNKKIIKALSCFLLIILIDGHKAEQNNALTRHRPWVDFIKVGRKA
jgi:hypothetical protein